jgi:hypothetical protein
MTKYTLPEPLRIAPPFVQDAPVPDPPPGRAFGSNDPPDLTKSRGVADRSRAGVQKATIWSWREAMGPTAPTGAAKAGMPMMASTARRASGERRRTEAPPAGAGIKRWSMSTTAGGSGSRAKRPNGVRRHRVFGCPDGVRSSAHAHRAPATGPSGGCTACVDGAYFLLSGVSAHPEG